MKLLSKLLLLALLVALPTSTLVAANTPKDKTDKEIMRKVDALMKKMTLREKIGQLIQLRPSEGDITGPDGEQLKVEDFIREGCCGSLLSVASPDEIMRFQRLAVDSSRLGIPLLFGHDVIHGCRIIFPENLGVSASWDVEAAERLARVSAEEAAAFGIAWTFSPMCDVSADPRWGRVSEGSGEDPYLGAAMARAMVRGYQGDDLSDPNTILACVKHFAAYGAPQGGRDYNTVDMSERMFRDRYLPPYRAAIDEGAATVMTSFNDFNAIPATGNKWLMRTVLRDELGFDGFVVTDYNAMHEMVAHGVAADGKEAAAMAFDAHVNMDMVDCDYLMYGEELVRERRVSEKTIDELCRAVLVAKFRLGLFDDPYRYGGDRYETAMYKSENLKIARDVARKSMVLLRNENDLLPLDGNERMALIGPFGDSGSEMLGSWSAFGEGDRSITFLEGLQERFGSENVAYTEGCKPLEQIEGGIDAAVAAANGADVVLLALGLPNKCSGEAASMTSIELPQPQLELLDAVAATGKPVAILLVTGRPMDITDEVGKVDAVLVTWHAGTMAGAALADVVSGDFNPSGRLTMTFPYDIGQVPIHYSMKRTGRPMPSPDARAKYLSRYLFTPNEPLYCFGYGLSYTTFDYSDLKVLTPEVKIGEPVRVSVKVTNSGKRDGDEVVQLYLHDKVASTTRPVRELKGFRKVALKAGESKVVEFTIQPEDMAFCRADMEFAQEPGDFDVWIGHDSNAPLHGGFTVKQDIRK